jgi:hypothetical protein
LRVGVMSSKAAKESNPPFLLSLQSESTFVVEGNRNRFFYAVTKFLVSDTAAERRIANGVVGRLFSAETVLIGSFVMPKMGGNEKRRRER